MLSCLYVMVVGKVFFLAVDVRILYGAALLLPKRSYKGHFIWVGFAGGRDMKAPQPSPKPINLCINEANSSMGLCNAHIPLFFTLPPQQFQICALGQNENIKDMLCFQLLGFTY